MPRKVFYAGIPVTLECPDEMEYAINAAKAPEMIERFGVEKVMGLWEHLVGTGSEQ
jgi:hypothetical protein